MTKRIKRLNSLLKEVLSDVVRKEVKNPHVSPLASITEVAISKDLQHAKVYISVIGSDEQRHETVAALQSAAGFISLLASKQVVMRYFPSLHFILDLATDHLTKIDRLLKQIEREKEV